MVREQHKGRTVYLVMIGILSCWLCVRSEVGSSFGREVECGLGTFYYSDKREKRGNKVATRCDPVLADRMKRYLDFKKGGTLRR